MTPWLIGLVMIVATAEPAPTCKADRECVITTWGGCCNTCCGTVPRAEPRKSLAKQQERCAVLRCPGTDCGKVACKPTLPAEEFVARCQAGTCVAIHQPPPPRCTRDDDCILVPRPVPADAACRHQPCGCCPSTNHDALHANQLKLADEPSAPAPAPAAPAPSAPREAPDAPSVQCSPCPGPAAERAACRAQRCVVLPVP